MRKGELQPPLRTKCLPKKVSDLGGNPPSPFTDIPPKNVLQKVLKMVFFAQKTPVFGPKIGLRIWGVPLPSPLRTKFSAKRGLRIWGVPPPPFMDKIRKVVFDLAPYRSCQI